MNYNINVQLSYKYNYKYRHLKPAFSKQNNYHEFLVRSHKFNRLFCIEKLV